MSSVGGLGCRELQQGIDAPGITDNPAGLPGIPRWLHQDSDAVAIGICVLHWEDRRGGLGDWGLGGAVLAAEVVDGAVDFSKGAWQPIQRPYLLIRGYRSGLGGGGSQLNGAGDRALLQRFQPFQDVQRQLSITLAAACGVAEPDQGFRGW
jgi:hypothetical protein